jgi:hypothetical protein
MVTIKLAENYLRRMFVEKKSGVWEFMGGFGVLWHGVRLKLTLSGPSDADRSKKMTPSLHTNCLTLLRKVRLCYSTLSGLAALRWAQCRAFHDQLFKFKPVGLGGYVVWGAYVQVAG